MYGTLGTSVEHRRVQARSERTCVCLSVVVRLFGRLSSSQNTVIVLRCSYLGAVWARATVLHVWAAAERRSRRWTLGTRHTYLIVATFLCLLLLLFFIEHQYAIIGMVFDCEMYFCDKLCLVVSIKVRIATARLVLHVSWAQIDVVYDIDFPFVAYERANIRPLCTRLAWRFVECDRLVFCRFLSFFFTLPNFVQINRHNYFSTNEHEVHRIAIFPLDNF